MTKQETATKKDRHQNLRVRWVCPRRTWKGTPSKRGDGICGEEFESVEPRWMWEEKLAWTLCPRCNCVLNVDDRPVSLGPVKEKAAAAAPKPKPKPQPEEQTTSSWQKPKQEQEPEGLELPDTSAENESEPPDEEDLDGDDETAAAVGEQP